MPLSINPDTPFFNNTTGSPVASGTAYFGLPNLDPKTNPSVSIYSDAEFTTAISATQSLTAAGKLQQFTYLSGPYSLLVEDSSGNQVFLNSRIDASSGSKVVDTRADLVALDATTFTNAFALGGDAKADGGHHSAYFISGDTTTPTSFIFADGAATGRWFQLPDEDGFYNLKAAGAGGGVNEDTTIIADAGTLAGIYGFVRFTDGTYLCNLTGVNYSLIGVGGRKTILKSYTSGNAVVTFAGGDALWVWRTIRDLEIDGDSNSDSTPDSDGIDYGTAVLTGRWVFERLWFNRCDKGIVKSYGNIGNSYNNLTFHENNFGYHATGVITPDIMHAGNDDFNKCEFHSIALAGIYVNSPTGGTGQHTLNGVILENCLGFGIFIAEYATSFNPFTLNDVWFEGNHTSGSVTIDSTSYTPRDIYVEDATLVKMNGGNLYELECVNSKFIANGVLCNAETEIITSGAGAQVLIESAYTDSFKNQGFIEKLLAAERNTGGAADVLITHPRTDIIKSTHGAFTVISDQDFANADTYSWTGTVSRTGTSVDDGLIFDKCCEVTLQNGDTNFGTSTGGTITDGKYICWSVDLKPTTSDIPTINFANGVTGATGLDSALVQNEWTSLAGVAEVETTGTIGLQMVNSTGSAITIRVSAYQCVSFDNIDDAVNYFNARKYYTSKQKEKLTGVHEFTDADGTPSIAIGSVFKTDNTVGTAITDFDDGVAGETIKVIIGDGNTTIDFTGTNLKGNAGADWSPAQNDHMTCTYDGTNWYCDISENTV